MADQKITALTAMTTPETTDVIPIVDDPAGTPTSQKISLENLAINSNFVLPMMQISAPSADFTLAAAAGVQSVFPATGDVLTVKASTTYLFDGQYILNTGITTHTTAMAFALAGATVSSFEYLAELWSAAQNTISTAQSNTHVSGVASKVINATSAAAWTIINFQGIARFTLGGTITPQINFSANPTGTNLTKVGSYIRFYEIGASSFVESGGWA